MRFILLAVIFNLASISTSIEQALAEQQFEPSVKAIKVDRLGRLSVEFKNALLNDVLDQFSRQANIRFIIRTAGNPKITNKFSNMPLMQGLEKLFYEFNYLVIHNKQAQDHPTGNIKTIILFSRGIDTDQTNQNSMSIDPQVHSTVYENLTHTDSNVRRKTIRNLSAAEIESYSAVISEMLTKDPDENVRVEAIRVLGSQETESIVEILLGLSNDESNTVRNEVINSLVTLSTEESMQAFKTVVINKSRH